VGYWIDYIKHTIQCIEGTKGGGLLDRLHKTYNAMYRGYKRGGLLDRLHKTYNTMYRGYKRGWVNGVG
jgi:pentatricopeptide repeat protein